MNVLVALLIQDRELLLKDKHNALYHESAATFKGDGDIQCLYGMVQAFIDCDVDKFMEQSKLSQLQLKKPYTNLLDTVVMTLKMTKLLQVIKPYSKVKVSYLQRRLNSTP